jgi:signal transduction histidine kinase
MHSSCGSRRSVFDEARVRESRSVKITSPILLVLVAFSALSAFSTLALADDESGAELHLTIEEKKWIVNHPKIRVASTMDWPPFDFVEDGTPKGLAIEYIELVFKKIGLDIEYTRGLSFHELIEEFKNKNIDVMPVLFFNEERAQFTDFTEEYYHVELGVLENVNAPVQIENLSGLKVGIQKGHGATSLLKARFPGIKLFEIPDNLELVKGLSEKRLDAIFGNPLVYYYYANAEGIKNIQFNDYLEMSPAEKSRTSFHVAVRKDWPILRSIIQKSMDTISDREFFDIESKWGNPVRPRNFNWTRVGQAAGALFLIILFLFWSNRKLKRIVSEKTVTLREMNESLEHTVDVRTKELLELNKELAQARDQAEASSGAKSMFLANMSHELRTPLNAVIGYSELIIEEAEEEERAYIKDVARIHKSGKHLLGLISDILDLSKIEAGMMGLELMYVDWETFVQVLVATTEPLARSNGNTLTIEASANLGRFCSDPTKLRQIALNLLSNACKFTKEGQVTMSLERQEDGERAELRMVIKDTGIGMAAKSLDKIFEDFSQADNSTTREYGGTGLGLAITQRLCEILGGSITAQSEIQVGSTFTVCLPSLPETSTE